MGHSSHQSSADPRMFQVAPRSTSPWEFELQGNLDLPDFVSIRLTWTATSTAAFGAYRATLASSPPRAPPLRSARYSATGVPRNLP